MPDRIRLLLDDRGDEQRRVSHRFIIIIIIVNALVDTEGVGTSVGVTLLELATRGSLGNT